MSLVLLTEGSDNLLGRNTNQCTTEWSVLGYGTIYEHKIPFQKLIIR